MEAPEPLDLSASQENPESPRSLQDDQSPLSSGNSSPSATPPSQDWEEDVWQRELQLDTAQQPEMYPYVADHLADNPAGTRWLQTALRQASLFWPNHVPVLLDQMMVCGMSPEEARRLLVVTLKPFATELQLHNWCVNAPASRAA